MGRVEKRYKYEPIPRPTKGQRHPTRSQYGGTGGFREAWFHQFVCNDAQYQGTLAFLKGASEDDAPKGKKLYPGDPNLGFSVNMLWKTAWRDSWWSKLSTESFVAMAAACRGEPGRYPDMEGILDELVTKQVVQGVNGCEEDVKYEIAWRDWKPGLSRDDPGTFRR